MPHTSRIPGLTSQESIKKLSTIEDGFSSRKSLIQDNILTQARPFNKLEDASDISPKKHIEVAFDVKFNSNYTTTKNVFSTGGNTQTPFKDGGAIPLHTRMIMTHGRKEAFDQSYLEPQPNPLTLTVNDITQQQAKSESLLQTKRKVKEYIDNINTQLTETKKQEITQIRDFRQYVKLIGNELQQQ